METKIFCKNIFNHFSKLFLIFILTNFLLTLTLFSQVRDRWVVRYNGPGNGEDTASELAIDDSGNVYVTGSSKGAEGTYQFATIKYDNDGNELWVARFEGPNSQCNNYANALAIDSSGNVYVAGTGVGEWSGYDCVVVKYNSSGEEQWVGRYDGLIYQYDEATDVALDNNGNVYITGKSQGYGTFPYTYDYVTIKYNNNGVAQWIKRYNGEGNWDDEANAIVVDGSGNVYVTGYSYGYSTDTDYVTIKYSTNGIEQWVKRYNTTGYDHEDIATAIVLDDSGNVYVTGYSYVGSSTIKYNNNGIQQWVARHITNQAYDMVLDTYGNVLITGEYNNAFITIKYNTSGIEEWFVVRAHIYTGDEGKAIAVDNLSNIYVTGYRYDNDTKIDYATIKYNTSGQEQWMVTYSGPGTKYDYVTDIAVDDSSNVYITGKSPGIDSGFDYVTIKYSQDVAVNQEVWMNY